MGSEAMRVPSRQPVIEKVLLKPEIVITLSAASFPNEAGLKCFTLS